MLTTAKWIINLCDLDNIGMRRNAKLPRTLGNRIQKRRKFLGLTQEELGEKVGVSRAYMGYIEQGRNTPSLEIVEKIARALKVSIKDLF